MANVQELCRTLNHIMNTYSKNLNLNLLSKGRKLNKPLLSCLLIPKQFSLHHMIKFTLITRSLPLVEPSLSLFCLSFPCGRETMNGAPKRNTDCFHIKRDETEMPMNLRQHGHEKPFGMKLEGCIWRLELT